MRKFIKKSAVIIATAAFVASLRAAINDFEKIFSLFI